MNKWLHKFLEKPDISDRFDLNASGKNLENMPEGGPDKPDRFDSNLNMSVLSGSPKGLLEENFSPYDEHDFEERLAIAEYDGGQTELHAHRIAYLDAFKSILISLPATDSQKDWLNQRIQTSLAWIESQGFHTIN